MSRLARKPIEIPNGVSVMEQGGALLVAGPKGEKRVLFVPGVEVHIEGTKVSVRFKKSDEARFKANEGTMWALIRNAIAGVSNGFSKVLEIEGVGYKAVLEGKEIVLSLGYALPVRFAVPEKVSVQVEKNVIKIAGIDKELVGQVAANIRALKKPEPYKGKGIRYQGEIIKRKVGKKAAATSGAA